MMIAKRLLTVLSSGILLLAGPLLLQAGDISDGAGFFSAAAIEKANQSIREIEKKSSSSIHLETHETVPADRAAEVEKMDRKQRDAYMDEWTKSRARELKEMGFLFLICKEPAHVHTWMNGRLHERGFTESQRHDVSEVMLKGFRAKDYDKALGDTVAKLGDLYGQLKPIPKKSATTVVPHTNHAPGTVQRTPAVHQQQSGWTSVIVIVGVVIAGIFLISLISRLFSGSRGYGGGQPGYGGGGMGGGGMGGGGFMSSLAGGIFGAVAGNWLYDSFSGRSAHGHDGQPTSTDPLSGSQTLGGDSPSSSDAGWTDEGSSSGGGWFDSGSGGDSSGGGDFGGGGGDSGGGGDFSGGGDF